MFVFLLTPIFDIGTLNIEIGTIKHTRISSGIRPESFYPVTVNNRTTS